MDNNTAITVRNFSKKYGKYLAVNDVSFKVQKGEVFGFLGPNGAGKSTTIRTLLDFIRATSGTLEVFGLDSKKDSVEIKKHLGYLAGDIALYESLTGKQIIDYLSNLGKNTNKKYVEELTHRLNATIDRKIKTLSKGNKQKIGLIQAFMHQPDLIILDEPTSGLDPLMKQVFYDMVLEMRNAGKTVFVSSHDLTEVQKICDRAAFIREGQLIAVEDISTTKQMALKKYEITFDGDVNVEDFRNIEGISECQVLNSQLNVAIKGSIAPFITELARHNPLSMSENETNIEDLFMHYYEKGDSNV